MVLYEFVCAVVCIFKQCVPCSYQMHFLHYEPMFCKECLIFHTVHLEMSVDRETRCELSVQEADCLMTFVGDSPLNRSVDADHLFTYERSHVRIVEKEFK